MTARPALHSHSTGREDPVAALCRRARSEYLEMPGLRLTTAQATRLWALDRITAERILHTLAAAGFLLRDREGAYLRATVAR